MAKQQKPFNSIKAPAEGAGFSFSQIEVLAGAVMLAALSERDRGLATADLTEIISGWLRAAGLEAPATEKTTEWETHFQTLFEGLKA